MTDSHLGPSNSDLVAASASQPGSVASELASRGTSHGSNEQASIVRRIPASKDLENAKTLPLELAHRILSFLPVDGLVDFLKDTHPERWQEIIASPDFSPVGVFGHRANICSSYGFIGSDSVSGFIHNLQFSPKPSGDPVNISELFDEFSALEHDSQDWRRFPVPNLAENYVVKMCKVSGSDGLLVFNMMSDQVDSPSIGLWNPLLRSFKLLPPILPGYFSHLGPFKQSMCFVMVGEETRTYKVLLLVSNDMKKALSYYNATLTPISYTVYESASQKWSKPQLLPDLGGTVHVKSASCDRYLILDSFDVAKGEVFLVLYDAHKDRWMKVFLSKITKEFVYPAHLMGFSDWHCIQKLMIFREKLYLVIRPEKANRHGLRPIIIVSIDLKSFGEGEAKAARLEFVTEVKPGTWNNKKGMEVYSLIKDGRSYICVAGGIVSLEVFDVSKGEWIHHEILYNEKNWREARFTRRNSLPFKASWVLP